MRAAGLRARPLRAGGAPGHRWLVGLAAALATAAVMALLLPQADADVAGALPQRDWGALGAGVAAAAGLGLGVGAGMVLARRRWRRPGGAESPQLLAGLHRAAIDSTGEALLITDADARVISVNPAFTKITGYAPSQAIGRDPRFLGSGRHDAAFFRQMWGDLRRDGQWQGEIWNRRQNGEIFPAWETISCVRDPAGKVLSYVALFSDIGTIKQAERRLEHLANHDPLTGLPNRLLLDSSLAHTLHRAARHGQQAALLFVDLDGFKLVNDTLGHATGDELLRVVGDRLRTAVRREDLVARLGGDEFIVVLEEIAGAAAALRTARKLLAAIVGPVKLGGRTVAVSASIGIALFPAHGTDADTLMHAADAAMYRAKRRGRSTCAFPGAARRATRRRKAAAAAGPV